MKTPPRSKSVWPNQFSSVWNHADSLVRTERKTIFLVSFNRKNRKTDACRRPDEPMNGLKKETHVFSIYSIVFIDFFYIAQNENRLVCQCAAGISFLFEVFRISINISTCFSNVNGRIYLPKERLSGQLFILRHVDIYGYFLFLTLPQRNTKKLYSFRSISLACHHYIQSEANAVLRISQEIFI